MGIIFIPTGLATAPFFAYSISYLRFDRRPGLGLPEGYSSPVCAGVVSSAPARLCPRSVDRPTSRAASRGSRLACAPLCSGCRRPRGCRGSPRARDALFFGLRAYDVEDLLSPGLQLQVCPPALGQQQEVACSFVFNARSRGRSRRRGTRYRSGGDGRSSVLRRSSTPSTGPSSRWCAGRRTSP